MILAVLALLLVLAFLAGLGAVGVYATLAPMDWLLIAGLTAIVCLVGVGTYRAMLDRWVSAGKHPFSLRVFAGILAALVWIAACELHLWRRIANAEIWQGDTSQPLFVATAFTLMVVVLLVVGFAKPRRIGQGVAS